MAKQKSLKEVEGTAVVEAEGTGIGVTDKEEAPAEPAVNPKVRTREEIFSGIIVESY